MAPRYISAALAIIAASSVHALSAHPISCLNIPQWQGQGTPYQAHSQVQLDFVAYEAIRKTTENPVIASAHPHGSWARLFECPGFYSSATFGLLNETTCVGVPVWKEEVPFVASQQAQLDGVLYEAKWWTTENPAIASQDPYGSWKRVGPCDDSTVAPSVTTTVTITTTIPPVPSTTTIPTIPSTTTIPTIPTTTTIPPVPTTTTTTTTTNPVPTGGGDIDCSFPMLEYRTYGIYAGGTTVNVNGVAYKNKYYSENQNPSTDTTGNWEEVGLCRPAVNTPYVPPKRVVGAYYTNWAQYRSSKPFVPENMDATHLTHILYGFGFIEADLTLAPFEWNDIRKDVAYTEGMYYRVQKLAKQQNPNCKVLLSLGGWNFSKGTGPGNKNWTKDVFPNAVKPENQARFCNNILSFVREHYFDGIDFDWEYPSNVEPGYPNQEMQRDQYTGLVRTCKEIFAQEGIDTNRTPILFTTATWASPKDISNSYDIPEISKYFDHIFIMTYDLYGAWDPVARPQTALFPPPALPEYGDIAAEMFSVERGVNAWVAKGAPAEKVVLGLGSYGRCVYLADTSLPLTQTNLNARVWGVSAPTGADNGYLTEEEGFLAAYEITALGQQGSSIYDPITRTQIVQWKRPDGKHGWCGYDTPATLNEKLDLLVNSEDGAAQGGAFFWAMDLDEFANKEYPLINAVADNLWPQNN